MIECLKRIIREYQNLEPPVGLLPRRVAIGSLPGKVSVVTGVRGSGKTTLLRQRIRQLLESGVLRESILPRKVYCIDHALVASVSSGILTNRDSLLENLVFTALRRVTPEIFYHKTKTGREVDLVALLPSVPGQERIIMLVQVCASLDDPRVKQSEVRSLSESMVELAVAEGIIVTWRTGETIPVGFGTIQVVPVWRFLLEMELRT